MRRRWIGRRRATVDGKGAHDRWKEDVPQCTAKIAHDAIVWACAEGRDGGGGRKKGCDATVSEATTFLILFSCRDFHESPIR